MLYTDGLVERRDTPIDEGIAQIADILMKTNILPVDDVADLVIEELVPEDGYDDDVVIVVCRPSPTPVRIEIDAVADQLADARHRLTAWLSGATVPQALAADIVLAVNEACTNSVEHAYERGERGRIRVEAEIGGPEIHVRVADSGLWKQPPSAPDTRGRGLPLIKALSDQGVLDGTPEGTTIEMSFRMPVTPRPTPEQ